jgi:hypothetical protein
MVMFGGQSRSSPPLDETWTWDGAAWNQAHPRLKPPPRTGALMAYDSARKVAVMFGGLGPGAAMHSGAVNLNDTWTWNGAWAPQHPAHSPSLGGGGWQSTMAFDPASQKVLLFGFDSAYKPQTWSWNGTDWSELLAVTEPETVGTMFSDGRHAYLVAVPFMPVDGRYVNQTWRWDGDTWTLLKLRHDLPASVGVAAAGGMAYDALHAMLVLLIRDTWTWDGSTWSRQHPAVSPPGTGYMVYFARLREVVSWGNQWGNPNNDMWAWDGTNWRLLQAGNVTPPTPSPGYGKGMTEAGPMSPEAAAALVRKTVTTESPVLLPTSLPAGLEATVWVGADGYTVSYASDQRDEEITWGIVVPNPPPPLPNSAGGHVTFRHVTAEYSVLDKTATYSSRWLMWSEPGAMATYPTKNGQVPFFLTADGLTDQEFWQVANSLR